MNIGAPLVVNQAYITEARDNSGVTVNRLGANVPVNDSGTNVQHYHVK